MGEHFVLLVDRLITETTLEAAIESRNQDRLGLLVPKVNHELTATEKNSRDPKGESKWVECRICQDEDEDCNMETPCSCCGSLKYAHRKCVQKWCNEKGDTMCEICLEQFKPDYTAPPKLFHYGRIPMNFRGNWEISHRDIQNHRFIALVQNNRELVGSSHSDDYDASSSRISMMICQVVATVLMALFILRLALPILMSGPEDYSLALLTLLLLRIAAIVLPLYVIWRAVITFHRRCFQQGTHEFSRTASEEPMQTI